MDAVVKRYGTTTVLNNLALSVEPGTVIAILGENGSGKSTLLRIAATLTMPSSGSIFVRGVDAVKRATEARSHIGSVMHSTMLYSDLTVRENLSLFATLCQLDAAENRIDEVSSRLRLTRRMDERVRKLSHGYRKRVSIARAILHSPDLLLLDEPETGLDTTSLNDLKAIVEEWRSKGRAVLMTTHNVDFVAGLADLRYRMLNGQLEPLD